MSKSYIGRCKCGNIVAASVIESDKFVVDKKELAKDVADWIREGLSVEQVDSEQVRIQMWGCRCAADNQDRLDKQMSLLLEER